MKKLLISLSLLLILPSVLFAETSYFLACENGKIINVIYLENKTRIFKRGDLFEVPENAQSHQGYPSINSNSQRCWSETGKPKCPLVLDYGRELFGSNGYIYLHGFVDLSLGCWFKSESKIPIKDQANNNYLKKFTSVVIGKSQGMKEELYEKSLDKQFVDIMCSEHTTQFKIAGIVFTDLKMKKSEEYLKLVEKNRLEQETKNERIRQQKEAEEERNLAQRREEERIKQEKLDQLRVELRKYGAEALVPINMLEVNPYEFEDRIIAVDVYFKRMMSRDSAIFYSGWMNLQDSTGVADEIIITGIPKGTHFVPSHGIFVSQQYTLALKGKGTMKCTNAYGATINVPHFQWIGIISRD